MSGKNERHKLLMKDAHQRFTEYCGVEPVSMSDGVFTTRVTIKEHHRQQDGFVHAGVIATMADHTAGYASYTLAPEDSRILTIEYKINFLAPAYGDYLECRAKVIKPGKRVLVAESEVFAVEGKEERLVAKALLTMAAVPSKDVDRKRKSSK